MMINPWLLPICVEPEQSIYTLPILEFYKEFSVEAGPCEVLNIL